MNKQPKSPVEIFELIGISKEGHKHNGHLNKFLGYRAYIILDKGMNESKTMVCPYFGPEKAYHLLPTSLFELKPIDSTYEECHRHNEKIGVPKSAG